MQTRICSLQAFGILNHWQPARCRPFSQQAMLRFGIRHFSSRAKRCSLNVILDEKPFLLQALFLGSIEKSARHYSNQTMPRSGLHRFSFPGKNPPLTGNRDTDVHLFSSGIGIPDHRKTALFRPFSQLDDAKTRRWGGTGLGLAICAQLVSLLGGKIGVDSNLANGGRGSEFHFTMRAQTCKGSWICALLSLTFSRDCLSSRPPNRKRMTLGLKDGDLQSAP